ncbi:MAG: tRNA (adenosine(37)-N6)-threonylcarbamoyltransferase complex dimerization subunit type 1 TsaB [Spirochaeta sp.]|nr:tRNA (adenosine(37)-N6)-threonylcarbamoyltransferase complex dimerization subunit type 1 TsaB [Spirochaeta sp.]
MRVLSLDTSSYRLSVALHTFSDTGVITADSAVSVNNESRHAEQLLPAIEYLLGGAGLHVPEIDLVVVAAGPGSFTGLRIGFATAKGLLAAGASDYIAVPAADCYAAGLLAYPGLVIPVLDARKRRWYGALYHRAKRLSSYLDLTTEDLLALIAGYHESAAPPLITGPDANLFCEQASAQASDIAHSYRLDSRHLEGIAPTLATVGRQRHMAGDRTPEDAGPDYLRMSEAEIGIRHSSRNENDFRA